MPEFPQVHPEDIKKAMQEVSSEPTFLMFHAEMLPSKHELHAPETEGSPLLYPNPSQEQSYQYAAFLESRPPSFETRAVNALVALTRYAPSLPIHVAHVSAAEVVPIIQEAQSRGVNISAETCFHYLALQAEQIALRDTRFKAEPPIRDGGNQKKLWTSLLAPSVLDVASDEKKRMMRYISRPGGGGHVSALRQNPISMVVSDHSPCAPADKLLPSYIPPHAEPPDYHDDVVASANGDFFRAWGGVSSLGLGLPILWTSMTRRTGVAAAATTHTHSAPGGTLTAAETTSLRQLTDWLSVNPARLVGLEHQKGRLQVGFDGDVLVFDPDCYWTVEGADLRFRHKMSPYQGRVMRGKVTQTWLRGRRIFGLGEETEEKGEDEDEDGFRRGEGPQGRLLLERRTRQVDGDGEGDRCRCEKDTHKDDGGRGGARLFDQTFLASCFGGKGIRI